MSLSERTMTIIRLILQVLLLVGGFIAFGFATAHLDRTHYWLAWVGMISVHSSTQWQLAQRGKLLDRSQSLIERQLQAMKDMSALMENLVIRGLEKQVMEETEKFPVE